MSGAEERMGRLDYLKGAITGKGPAIQNQYAKLGAKMVSFPGFFIRQEVLIREKLTISDKRVDVEDRVSRADDLLDIIGQPYTESGDMKYPAWTAFHFHWKMNQPGWRDRVGKRRWYRVEKMASVRDWVEVQELKELDDGTNQVISRFIPLVREIHEETLAVRKTIDESKKDAQGKYPEWYKPLEFLAWVPQRDERILGMLDLLGYDKVAKEEALLLEGEELVALAMYGLGFAWTTRNTPGQSADVFMVSAPAQNPGGQIVPTSGLRRPGQSSAAGMRP